VLVAGGDPGVPDETHTPTVSRRHLPLPGLRTPVVKLVLLLEPDWPGKVSWTIVYVFAIGDLGPGPALRAVMGGGLG
jgi:hypothetical protein